jgi:hypothetical protein
MQSVLDELLVQESLVEFCNKHFGMTEGIKKIKDTLINSSLIPSKTIDEEDI